MSVRMDVPQVGFDQQVAKRGAADLKGVRIFSLTGAAKIIGQGLGGSPGMRPQELDLNPYPPQRAVSGNQNDRAERVSLNGNVVHHFQTWGRWRLTSMNDPGTLHIL
jgi:hypothetical protein